MAKKTIREQIEAVKINPYYDLTINETNELKNEGELFTIIYSAFKLGYCKGSRAEKARLKAKAK